MSFVHGLSNQLFKKDQIWADEPLHMWFCHAQEKTETFLSKVLLKNLPLININT